MASEGGSVQGVGGGQARVELGALVALIIGAVAIGASPIFVRLSDLGPFATAFWRVALALPVLWAWAYLAARDRRAKGLPAEAPGWRAMLPAGLFFAGDLTFWHLSILNTTVANATLFANFSAVVVTIGAWLFLREKIGPRFLIGLALAILGAAVLSNATAAANPGNLLGDFYGIVTAFFFGAYMLSVRHVRGRTSAAQVMLRSGIITAAALLVVALVMGDALIPQSARGWAVLLGLALFSHAAGQGFLAYALGHLPASFSSLVVLLEPVAAAILGWLILFEAISLQQGIGGAIILTGVIIARRASKAKTAEPGGAP